MPLIPYFTALGEPAVEVFPFAIAAALAALFAVGLLRSRVALKKWYVNCGEVMAVGTVAGGAAYGIGTLLRAVIG
jgi:VIT1/CCC1 family predicted Fe2+/Mn2+ transporter